MLLNEDKKSSRAALVWMQSALQDCATKSRMTLDVILYDCTFSKRSFK